MNYKDDDLLMYNLKDGLLDFDKFDSYFDEFHSYIKPKESMNLNRFGKTILKRRTDDW